MSSKTPFYKEWYLWVCLIFVVAGAAVVGMDVRKVRAKKYVLAVKTQAERLLGDGDFAKAADALQVVTMLSTDAIDPEIKAAFEQAGRDLKRTRVEIAKQTQDRLAREQIVEWVRQFRDAIKLRGLVAKIFHRGPRVFAVNTVYSYAIRCGAPLSRGGFCHNRPKEGALHCHLHTIEESPSYSSSTYVGPRGGVYHYSKNGNKVYHKR